MTPENRDAMYRHVEKVSRRECKRLSRLRGSSATFRALARALARAEAELAAFVLTHGKDKE